MSDPTRAKIIIDVRTAPGTTSYSSAEGVWRVHSAREARVVSEDRSRWVWASGQEGDVEPGRTPSGDQQTVGDEPPAEARAWRIGLLA